MTHSIHFTIRGKGWLARRYAKILSGVLGVLTLWLQTAQAASPDLLEHFEQRIRPILANECYECHGAKKQKGGLRVDFRGGLLSGGESGPALIPDDAKRSLLLQKIRHANPDSGMPKDRPQLPESVIADFAKWVDQGAVDPRDRPQTVLPDPMAGPVGWADRLFHSTDPANDRFAWVKAGAGIMLDDLVAAMCTLLVIAVWRWI